MASFSAIPTVGAGCGFGYDANKYAKLASVLPSLAGTTGANFGTTTENCDTAALNWIYHQALVNELGLATLQAKNGEKAFAGLQTLCNQQAAICQQICSSTGYPFVEAFDAIKTLTYKMLFTAKECYMNLQELAAKKHTIAQEGLSFMSSPAFSDAKNVLAAEESLVYSCQKIGQIYYETVRACTNEQCWIIKKTLNTLEANGFFASPAGVAIKQALLTLQTLATELTWGAHTVWSFQQALTFQQVQTIKEALNAICGGFGGVNTWTPAMWNNQPWSTYNNNYFNNNNNWRMGNFWNNTPFNGTVANNSNLYNVAFRPSNAVEFYSLTNPIRVLDREGNRQLWLCYELKGFKPEEVTVTFNKAERAVVVEAAHEVKEGKEHHILRKFYRKFVLPESFAKIDLSKIELKSCLNAEGFLTIECILPKMTTEEIAKCPIMSKINEMPFYGYGTAAGFNAGSAVNAIKPVTVKTA